MKLEKTREFMGGRRWSLQDGEVIDHGPVKWTEYKLASDEDEASKDDSQDNNREERKSA